MRVTGRVAHFSNNNNNNNRMILIFAQCTHTRAVYIYTADFYFVLLLNTFVQKRVSKCWNITINAIVCVWSTRNDNRTIISL